MKKILIIGAHSAVAKSLFEVLEERDVEVDLIRATTSDHLEEGLVLLDEAKVKSADLIVVAMETAVIDVAKTLAKPILDLTESLADEDGARWIFPGLDAGVAFDPARPAIIPVGLGAPIVAVLRALATLAPKSATIVTQESAAVRGRAGMDELSDQVRSRFNMRDIEPKVFPAVIAFGVIPEEDEASLRAAIEAGVASELPELELFIMRSIVPTFSADSANVVLELGSTPDVDEVKKLLEGAKGVHVFDDDETPSSFEAVGRDDVLAGRVTVEEGRVGLWLACDRLRRGSATLAALAIEKWIAP